MSVKWKWISILSSVVLTVALAGAWLFGAVTTASASEMTAADVRTLTQSTTEPGLLGEGYLAHGGWGRGGKSSIDYQQLLADALGITVQELEDAYEAARVAAIEQAVEQGLVTREQADEMLVWGSKSLGRMKGLGGFGGHGGAPNVQNKIDENALLAKALGITTEELQAAREQANQAALEQAVAEGLITQEQADEMAARKQTAEALQSYLGRDVLLAKALGMTVEELQAAYDDGKSLSDLLSERGLDAVTVRENMQAAHETALAQAVEDGVITQEQADEMSDRMLMGGPGMRGFGGRGHAPGPGGFGGRGGFEGQRRWSPDTEGDDGTDGTHFRRPGRMSQDSSAL